MTTSLPRRIDADEVRVGDLIERRMAVVRGRVFQVSDTGVARDADGNLLWHPEYGDSDWGLWLLDRPEAATERFTREVVDESYLAPGGAALMTGALEAMWAAGWTVTPPADAEPEVQ